MKCNKHNTQTKRNTQQRTDIDIRRKRRYSGGKKHTKKREQDTMIKQSKKRRQITKINEQHQIRNKYNEISIEDKTKEED